MISHNPPIRIVVFASGNGSNLQVIVDKAQIGELSVEVVAVISDQENAYALERARKANIRPIFVNPDCYRNRLAYDEALKQVVVKLNPQLIVLAGFMRILSAEFVAGYENRIMNIHPSLLPKFKGLNTHERALAAGERYHGATVHFVTADLDDGPIIVQHKVPVLPDDSVDTLEQRVHECEYEIYPRAIQWFADEVLKYGHVQSVPISEIKL
ncbi:MAG: phosphoribosylglycinamide formyltransferase [Acidiferrobacterales bacterium]|nr:phosphoribosylglycinamide formyltransferase [Acidiferrobacterales bacterium]